LDVLFYSVESILVSMEVRPAVGAYCLALAAPGDTEPFRVPFEGGAFTAARGVESTADGGKDAGRLAETLHSKNAERARRLLGIARWPPLVQRLRQAEQRLAELGRKGSTFWTGSRS
jgi:hypothetical protein